MRPLLIGAAGSVAIAGLVIVALGPSKPSPEAIQGAVSTSGEALERAWDLPVAATYRPHLTWQSNGSRCGPASLANLFRSLGEPAATEASVLSGTWRCATGFCILGLTLDQLAEVARAHTTRRVAVLRDLTLDGFREELRRSNDLGRRYVVNFARDRIFGAGAGHHSPIGGYLKAEDLVLVIDVNPDFRPWLIDSRRLFEAMDTMDGERKRGLLLIE